MRTDEVPATTMNAALVRATAVNIVPVTIEYCTSYFGISYWSCLNLALFYNLTPECLLSVPFKVNNNILQTLYVQYDKSKHILYTDSFQVPTYLELQLNCN